MLFDRCRLPSVRSLQRECKDKIFSQGIFFPFPTTEISSILNIVGDRAQLQVRANTSAVGINLNPSSPIVPPPARDATVNRIFVWIHGADAGVMCLPHNQCKLWSNARS